MLPLMDETSSSAFATVQSLVSLPLAVAGVCVPRSFQEGTRRADSHPPGLAVWVQIASISFSIPPQNPIERRYPHFQYLMLARAPPKVYPFLLFLVPVLYTITLIPVAIVASDTAGRMFRQWEVIDAQLSDATLSGWSPSALAQIRGDLLSLQADANDLTTRVANIAIVLFIWFALGLVSFFTPQQSPEFDCWNSY